MPDLTHIEQIRKEMPVTASCLYLNTGTFGPLPGCVPQAMQQQVQREWQQGRLGVESFGRLREIYQSARQGVARLLHADEDEIALTDNTGEGLNIVSYGFNWQAGDEVITTNHEHISLLAPLYQLRDRYGIVVRVADLGPSAERPIAQAIGELVTPRTRLIACSHISWKTGTLLNVSELGLLGREQKILVLIDGAQSAGVIPIDIHALNIDFYAIPGQKWLCGPDGTGALYARREAIDAISSTYVGYWSAKDVHAEEWAVMENAQRFEVGGRQTAALAAQAAVLKWMEEMVGYAWLYERIATLHTYAYAALTNVPGLSVLTPHPGESGLLTITLRDQDPEKMVTYLREQHNIYIRTIPDINALRISTGFYNTEAEIDTLVKALAEYQATN